MALNLMTMEITHPFSNPHVPLRLEIFVTALLLPYPQVCISANIMINIMGYFPQRGKNLGILFLQSKRNQLTGLHSEGQVLYSIVP